jgi:hypothetical protein
MSICGICGGRIELGSSITKGCKECFETALSFREDAIKRGTKLPKLAPWVGKVQSALDKFLSVGGRQ